jgi:ribosomal-protein-serine acetyltransferase
MTNDGQPVASDHKVVLSDETLLLRTFCLDDAEAIYEAACESKPQLQPWLPWCHDKYAIADTIEFLQRRAAAYQKEGEYAFAILDRPTGRFVGATGINQVDKAARRANLGYWLRTSATGRGYATRSTLIVARWAFEALELERIEIVVAVGNERSQRVAHRVGATREGIARRRLRVGPVQHDAVVFSLIPSDVLPQQG